MDRGKGLLGLVALVAGVLAAESGLGSRAVLTEAGCGNGATVAPLPVYEGDAHAGDIPEGGRSGTGGGSADASGANGPCRSAADCSIPDTVGVFCWNGGPLGLPFTYCGAFTSDLCQSDADCAETGVNKVCIPEGVCGGMKCGPRCTSDSDCPGEPPGAFSCLANGHCGEAPCVGSGDCPPNYVCAAGSCGARCCTRDSDCVDFCVNGACSSQLGQCRGDGSGGATPGAGCAPGS
jgi:hypothetical protein